MKDRLTALKLFARAARIGNFSSAGRQLGLSQPSASRVIAALEDEVGATFFSRTTRAVTLTEAGTTYLMRVEAILAELDEADHEARGTGELRGVLRVGTSSSFVRREIIPRLARFMKEHPSLRIELLASDRYQDLVSDHGFAGRRLRGRSHSTAEWLSDAGHRRQRAFRLGRLRIRPER